jgi:hypothetical protein
MRLTLSLLAAVLAAAAFTSPARAQSGIPYRRTYDYISSRPYEFTGRYVRINASVSFGQPTGIPGRTTTSMTLQGIINVPGSSAAGLGGGNGDGGGAFGAPGGGGAGRGMVRRGGPGTSGVVRGIRFGR